MTENIGVLLVATAGLVGVILGLYALTPLLFRKRLRSIMTALTPDETRIVQEEIALIAEEQARARASGPPTAGRSQLRIVVPSPEASRTVEPASSVDPMPDVDRPAWQSLAATAIARQRTPAEAASPVALAAVEPDPAAIEIFRDLKPTAGAATQRPRPAAIRESQAHPVAIRELLSEARWTTRGLRPSPGTLRYARRHR